MSSIRICDEARCGGKGGGVIFGIANEITNESSDDFGKANDGHADEGVGDGLFGFFGFGGVATGGNEADAAKDDKDNCDHATHADDPTDELGDHGVGINAGATADRLAGVGFIDSDTVCGEIDATEADADGVEDDTGGHNDGKADKGLAEDFFAGGDFGAVAVGEDVEIASVDDVAEDKI